MLAKPPALAWTLAVVFLLTAIASGPARAQSGFDVQSTKESTDAARRRLDRADAALLRRVRDIPAVSPNTDSPARDIAKLVTGWRTYTTHECAVVGDLTGGTPIWQGIYAMICEERRYKRRTRTVIAAAACLSRALMAEQPDVTQCVAMLFPAGDGQEGFPA